METIKADPSPQRRNSEMGQRHKMRGNFFKRAALLTASLALIAGANSAKTFQNVSVNSDTLNAVQKTELKAEPNTSEQNSIVGVDMFGVLSKIIVSATIITLTIAGISWVRFKRRLEAKETEPIKPKVFG